MKHTFILSLLFICQIVYSQPQSFNYQGVARNAAGNTINNQNISLRLSILDGSAVGPAVYVETSSATTNNLGLFTTSIGTGNIVSGVFANIAWSQANKWLKVEMDAAGGTNYVLMGTSQFLSVPYAIQSKSSENGLPAGTAPGDMLYWNGASWQKINPGSNGQPLVLCGGVPTWGGCLAQITTNAINTIIAFTASGGGVITNDGGTEITAKGICWSTSPTPTIANSQTTDGAGPAAFTSYMTGLTNNTTYYVRAYATNSAGTGYGNELTFTTQEYYLGQSTGGGKVFYVDNTGSHGLIAATTDQSTNAQWGCISTNISTSTAPFTGQANTNAIIAGCATAGIAARLCNDLVLNGFSDWYLPGYYELDKMYNNKSYIGSFTNGFYWSSSQYNIADAWIIQMNVGSLSNGGKNATNFCTRAIRSF